MRGFARRAGQVPVFRTLLITGPAFLAISCTDLEEPATPSSRVADAASFQGVLPATIDFPEFVDSLKTYMPRSGSGGYVPPNAQERAQFSAAVERAIAGDLAAADSLVKAFRYDVDGVIEATTGDSLVVFVEQAPIERGWGTYVFNTRDLISPPGRPARWRHAVDVHVNHPLWDVNTPRVGSELFLTCDCRWFLMAGTHRYANPDDESDMARATTSIFQAIYEEAAATATQAISVHGFVQRDTAEIVLSNGRTPDVVWDPQPSAADLRDRLLDAGYETGVFALDEGYDYLGAGANPQGQYANGRFGHGRWMHVELVRPIRDDPELWRAVNQVIAEWARTLPRRPPQERAIVPDTSDFREVVASIRAAMPGSGSNAYVPPTSEERGHLQQAVDLVLAGEIAAVDSLLRPYRYHAATTVEASTGDSLVFLVEQTPVQRGWGTFVLNRSASAIPVNVHVVDPRFAVNSSRVGAGLFLECRCQWFLMAGTHRNANPDGESDMGLSTTSVVQAVHEHVIASVEQAISIHGFTQNDARPHEIVLSNGRTSDGVYDQQPSAEALRDRLRAGDFEAGVFSVDEGYDYLGGGTNVQGQHANDQLGHGRWIYVQLARTIRDSEPLWQTVNEIVAGWAGDFVNGSP
jgi:hypothetical protein